MPTLEKNRPFDNGQGLALSKVIDPSTSLRVDSELSRTIDKL